MTMSRENMDNMIQGRITIVVRNYMQMNGLSVREAAQRLDMKVTTLHNKLNGDSDWTLVDAMYIAYVLQHQLVPHFTEL